MGTADQISQDDIFEVLSSSRRRHLLYFLHNYGGVANLRDLAEETAREEFGEPLDEDQIKRIYIAFYQTHIPKLEDVGFVRYDKDEQEVELTDDVRAIARVLPHSYETTHPWPLYYLGVAALGMFIAIVTWLEIGNADAFLSVPLVTAGLSIILVLLSIWYSIEWNQQRQNHGFLDQIVAE